MPRCGFRCARQQSSLSAIRSQVTTGYVDDSSTCLSSDPVDKNTAYGNYPTLLNGPLSSAVSCKAPVPFCVPHVQATWSAPPPPFAMAAQSDVPGC